MSFSSPGAGIVHEKCGHFPHCHASITNNASRFGFRRNARLNVSLAKI
jgi:hypothetical protein